MAGKGSKARPFSVDTTTFNSNWDLAFGKKKEKDMQVRVATEDSSFGKCGCGRSPTGKCIGWHGLNEEQLKEAQAKYAEEIAKQ
jgi:hypothetical protein